MRHSTWLCDVRARFGLSQQELAIWLGLSRATLAKVETDRRALPSRAGQWLRPWVTALLLPPATAVPQLPAPADPTNGPAALLARLAECRYQAQRLHQQLLNQQAYLNVLRDRLAAGPLLQAALPPPAPAEPVHAPAALRRRWLARLLEAATDELSVAPEVLTLLAARCHAWQSEAAWLVDALALAPSA